jgi:hypothetical protein
MAPKPMRADELLKHPEYEHTIWDLKPTKAGKVAVAQGRGGPLNIAYEVHGHGSIHLVVRRSSHCCILVAPSCITVLHILPSGQLPEWARLAALFVTLCMMCAGLTSRH